ncbi:universal stress protein [Jiella sonneratiae]|uniref:Universal stress protein n=1 Tax=Jiella sonneratiae TaxID=2816856 RepID=A0ABS3J0K6_9HYPH|nr:universal stress protein [Jiella sonneratiae]MBO0903196.1 universal stress protein [Jiella sonneratiae]
MKAILVPAETHGDSEHALRMAAEVARRFAGHVESFALQLPPLVNLTWDPAGVAIMNGAEFDHRRIRDEARRLAARVMSEEDVPIAPAFEEPAAGAAAPSDAPGEASAGPSWAWNDRTMAGDAFLGAYGRAFDLTVVCRPRPEGASITTLESALFESGGPILIAPPHPVSRGFGRTVAVAWNGSSETARTIAFARPFLRSAERVVVIADDGGLNDQPSGALIQRRLARCGVPVELKLLPAGGIRSGEQILKEAAALGADLLLKGAYTQSRLRQMIFGGATSQILSKAELPVFMAH